jgi:hypothetical protein
MNDQKETPQMTYPEIDEQTLAANRARSKQWATLYRAMRKAIAALAQFEECSEIEIILCELTLKLETGTNPVEFMTEVNALLRLDGLELLDLLGGDVTARRVGSC